MSVRKNSQCGRAGPAARPQAELIAPIHAGSPIDAMGWTGSTPAGGVEGEVVTANLFDLDAEMEGPARFRGKIVMMKPEGTPKKNVMLIFAQFGDFLNALQKAGAIAVIGGQGGFPAEGMHLTHTGILGFAADFADPCRRHGPRRPGPDRTLSLFREKPFASISTFRTHLPTARSKAPMSSAKLSAGNIRKKLWSSARILIPGISAKVPRTTVLDRPVFSALPRPSQKRRHSSPHHPLCPVHRRRAGSAWLARVREAASSRNEKSHWRHRSR